MENSRSLSKETTASTDILVYYVGDMKVEATCGTSNHAAYYKAYDDDGVDDISSAQESTMSGIVGSAYCVEVGCGYGRAPIGALAHEIGHLLTYCPDLPATTRPQLGGPEHADPSTGGCLVTPNLMTPSPSELNIQLNAAQIANVRQTPRRVIFIVVP